MMHSTPLEIRVDFETRSDVDLKTRGQGPYFNSPHWKALCASYRIGPYTIERWRYGEPCPPRLREAIEAGATIRAFNASFERQCFEQLHKREGWPLPRIEQYVCTAAQSAANSLPRSLDDVGSFLNLAIQKDKEGKRLIDLFSKPRKPRVKQGEDPNGVYWNEPEDFPEDFEKFQRYCSIDVEVEERVDHKVIRLRTECQAAYTRNERINARGIRIDTESARAALILADRAKGLLDKELRAATGGAVQSCSQVAEIKKWCRAQLQDPALIEAASAFFGDDVNVSALVESPVDFDSLAKADMEDMLERDDLPENVRKVLSLRQEYAKTSVSKIKSFLKRADEDSRIRNSFLFRAAGTGRYSSTGAQVHNMPRPRKIFGDEHPDAMILFEAIRQADPSWLKFLYGEELGRTLSLLSDAIRGFIWAGPCHELLAADYSGIEGAVQAWFVGEEWKLKALFDLIADPTLPDMYRRSAAGIYNTTTDELTKKDPRRQVGKVSELSLGYQGGVGAFRSMARNYSLKLGPIFAPAWEAADPERRERAVERHAECSSRGELLTKLLTREEWIGAELIKVGWRAAHPATVAAWKALENGAKAAVEEPGLQVTVLKVTYRMVGTTLYARLPSGRCLSYQRAQIREVEVPWADRALTPELREKRPVVTCMGVDSQTRRMVRYPLYGGLLFENFVQAIALDLLDNGIEIAERAGYPVIAHVHDEIVAEVPAGWGDLDWFEKAICELPEWARGLPLTAGGWRGKRYRKD
jgi:DNA polymerase